MSKYVTRFTLNECVRDMNEANEYLQDEDMTVYLKNDVPFHQKIESIVWTMTDDYHGTIVLRTVEPLTREELAVVSEWVSGQNSDGLGEGFSQQEFAHYDLNHPYNPYHDHDLDEGEDWVTCEFDWRKNEYLFEEERE